MDLTVPIKNLTRLNWLAAAVGSVYVFFYSIPDTAVSRVSIAFTILAGVGLLFSGYMNVFLLVWFRRKFGIESRRVKAMRFFLSLFLAVAFYMIAVPICAAFVGVKWDFFNVKIVPSVILHTCISDLLILFLQNIIVLQHDKNVAELELTRLKASNAEAANLLLRQQIHPHFLFNALNTLKALYKKDAAGGEDYLVHLASFLRASVSNHTARITTLADELDLLWNYLEMQRIRFGAALVCAVELEAGDAERFCLPSFSLQPLLENAIKHNEVTEENPLYVRVAREGDWIVVSNNIQAKRNKENSGGSGLANLAERYRLWSGDDIHISDNGSEFTVRLKILPR